MTDALNLAQGRDLAKASVINASRLKSGFDRAAALVALVLLSPLLLLVAVIIRLDSPGRVLFTQQRYGLDGTTFRIYKFRTMTATASTEAFRQATAGDFRITRLGRVLRNTSIDELPQLLNVLKGDMALVGPRPHPIALDDTYSPQISDYMLRYAVRPGLTGLAQVSGQRGPTPTVEDMARRVKFDLDYIERWSFWLDLQILFRTIGCMTEVRHAK